MGFSCLQLLQFRTNAGNHPFCFFRFLFFALCHQRANLLAGHIALIAQRIRFGCRRAQLCVQFDYLVHQNQFFILEFLFDVFFDQFRIGSDQANVDHVINPPSKQKRNLPSLFMGRKIPRCHPNCQTKMPGLLLVRYRVPAPGSSPAARKVDRTASLPDLHQPPTLLQTALTFIFLKCVWFEICLDYSIFSPGMQEKPSIFHKKGKTSKRSYKICF